MKIFGSLSFDWAQRQFELALFDRDGLILTSYHGALFDSGGRAMDLGFGGKRAQWSLGVPVRSGRRWSGVF